MNLNNLQKSELIETINKMVEELQINLADNSNNKIERYINIDTNEQTFIIKTGQFKINEEQLRKLINESDELTIESEKTEITKTEYISIIKLITFNESLAKHLIGCLAAKVELDIINIEEKDQYILNIYYIKNK